MVSKILPQLRKLYLQVSEDVKKFKSQTGSGLDPIYRTTGRIPERLLWIRAVLTRDLLRRTLLFAGKVSFFRLDITSLYLPKRFTFSKIESMNYLEPNWPISIKSYLKSYLQLLINLTVVKHTIL